VFEHSNGILEKQYIDYRFGKALQGIPLNVEKVTKEDSNNG